MGRGQRSPTCREANGHQHFGAGGGQGGLGGLIESSIGVQPALGKGGGKGQRSTYGGGVTKIGVHQRGGEGGVTYRVKGRKVKGRRRPPQKEFLGGVEGQRCIEGELGGEGGKGWGAPGPSPQRGMGADGGSGGCWDPSCRGMRAVGGSGGCWDPPEGKWGQWGGLGPL